MTALIDAGPLLLNATATNAPMGNDSSSHEEASEGSRRLKG